MSGSSTAPVDWRVPSAVRSFEIYPGGARPGQGLVGPNALPWWVAKHPLEIGSWWVNATAWCQDVGDTLLAPPAWAISPADGSLAVIATAVSSDGFWAGFLLTGGIAGTEYTLTLRLIGRTSGVSWAGGVCLPCLAPVAVPPVPPCFATMNRSLLTVGGKTLIPGSAS